MRKTGWTILALAIGMLLAAGFPFTTVTPALADPGCGHHEGCGHGCSARCEGCPGCGCGECEGEGIPPCMQDNAAAAPGGMHRMMHCRDCGRVQGMPMGGGGPMMMKGMARHMETMRGTILKLRALEAKMKALAPKEEAAFRAASLEHAKLLTDIQESHLKHMESMMGK